MTAPFPAHLLAPVEGHWITQTLEEFEKLKKPRIYFGTNSSHLKINKLPPLIKTVLFKSKGTTFVSARADFIDITHIMPHTDARLEGEATESYDIYYGFNNLKKLPEPIALSSLSYSTTGNAVPNSVPGCCFVKL
jgi:hypothetical protein